MHLKKLLLPFLGTLGFDVLAQRSALGPPSTDSTCANPPMGQCVFYANCLESRYHCGPDGYPLNYGQRICQRFIDQRALLDLQGQQWMLATMHCLQEALVGDATDASPEAGDCEALETQAFASHARCYVSNGFCKLSVEDWAAVIEILGVGTLLESWDAIKGTVETVEECIDIYVYMVEKGLF